VKSGLIVGPRRFWRVTWLVGFTVATLGGCEELLSIQGEVVVAPGDAQADSSSTPSCGIAIADPSCGACLNAHCCAEMTACSTTQGCGDYETCLLGCGADYACRAACDTTHPGAGKFQGVPTLDVCVTSNCERECGLSCGLVFTTAPVDAAVTCQACIAANGCPAAEACARSLDCNEVVQCIESCPTADCKEACGNGHDAGLALLESFNAPIQAACETACAVGENWSCVGNVVLPVANGADTLVTVTVTTISGAVVPGVTVRGCAKSDLTCASPLDSQTTDSNGVAAVRVRGAAIGYGFDGYYDIARASDVDATAPLGPQIVPFLFFATYSSSQPTAALSAVALTPSDLASLAAHGGLGLDDAGTLGTVVAIAFDCRLQPAPGVTFAASSGGTDLGSRLRYLAGVNPDPAATATDRSGIGFLFGVPALEDIALTMSPLQLGHEAGTVHAFARAGGVSLVPVVPR
jgi:hypothetical protein